MRQRRLGNVHWLGHTDLPDAGDDDECEEDIYDEGHDVHRRPEPGHDGEVLRGGEPRGDRRISDR